MLVLSAFENQSIYIKCPDGTDIQVRFLEKRGDSIRLGFEAPLEYVIVREKFYEKTAEEFRGDKGKDDS